MKLPVQARPVIRSISNNTMKNETVTLSATCDCSRLSGSARQMCKALCKA